MFFLVSGASYYERLNDSENISSDEIRVISNPIPTDSSTAALLEKQQQQQMSSSKRSPLTRMKSDTLDVEKRAKFAKNAEIAGANFRPISMMNLVSYSCICELCFYLVLYFGFIKISITLQIQNFHFDDQGFVVLIFFNLKKLG